MYNAQIRTNANFLSLNITFFSSWKPVNFLHLAFHKIHTKLIQTIVTIFV